MWSVVLVMAVVGGALAFVVVDRVTPQYASTVTFFVSTANTRTNNAFQGAQFGEQRVGSYAKLLGSETLAERVVASSSAGLSTAEVMEGIAGEVDLNTVILTATVTDTSPSRSLEVAAAVAEEFPALVDDLETQGGTQQAPARLDVVSGPRLEPGQVSPRKRLAVLVGVLSGAFLGVLAVMVLAVTRPAGYRAARGAVKRAASQASGTAGPASSNRS